MPTDHHDDHRPSGARGGGRLEAVIVCAVLAICSVIVAGVAWTHPTRAAAPLAYTQAGRVSYSAPTSPASVYGAARLTTGQPIYGSVVSAVTVSYAYRFQAAAPAFLSGTEQLVARISNGQGITRTIPIQSAATPFTGERFTVSGTLDMAALKSVAGVFDQVAGTQSNFGTYAVTISPLVSVYGRLGPAPLNAAFNSPVSFSYSSGNLIPGGRSSAAGTQGTPVFTVSSAGSVSLPSGKPATLLLGIPVSGARVGSLAVLLASLLVLGFAGWPLLREATSSDEHARIAARYPSSIVEADAVAAHPGVVVVELGSFEGLLQVARRLECQILHWGDAGDVYAVVDSGTLYRYRTALVRGPELARRPEGNSALPGRPRLTQTAERPATAHPEAAEIRGREGSDHAERV